ncbi:hypothetical protein OHA98_41035 [Streptomyces sp. NBC_00654]|uniref:hypothetical protein n=1 Tax=Streptomyces sp. NBC_00654 TaxID=2975799 RepID=UPI0022583A5B|nr:hypothetical protein [Streptomyces sp. NBC_00654]MCX4971001.1 hypothetical protein [Streptomyces sp. NBC_00654]
MSLFTRTAPAAVPETWTPEGTIVSQRYRALEGATVLVYTADTDHGTPRYVAACLGCTHRADRNTAGTVMTEAEAATAANAHAAACRAMPRGIPARPDDTEAAKLIRTRLWAHRYGTSPHPVRLSDFDGLRVDLQRPTDRIKALLGGIAQADPGFLTAAPADSGQGVRFTVQPFDRP